MLKIRGGWGGGGKLAPNSIIPEPTSELKQLQNVKDITKTNLDMFFIYIDITNDNQRRNNIKHIP